MQTAAHAYHETLPGYDPDRLLQDGCPVCEARGKDPLEALVHLDADRLRKAWVRAAAWQRDRLDPRHPVSAAEAPMLRTIWTIELLFERFGIAPLGRLPRPVAVVPLGVADTILHLRECADDPDSDLNKRITPLEREAIMRAVNLLVFGQLDGEPVEDEPNREGSTP